MFDPPWALKMNWAKGSKASIKYFGFLKGKNKNGNRKPTSILRLDKFRMCASQSCGWRKIFLALSAECFPANGNKQ